MWIIKILLGLLLLPVAVYLVLALALGREGLLERVFGPVARQPVDFATLKLKPSPNQYLVCPPGHCAAQPHAESPVFEVPLEQLRAAWFRVVEQRPRVRLLASDPENEQYEWEARTAVLLFPDTVTVRFIPLEGDRSTLAIYSRSHYGYGDLGVNQNRITDWLERLRQELERRPPG